MARVSRTLSNYVISLSLPFASETENKKKSGRKKSLLALVLILVVGGGYAIWHWWKKPVFGTLTSPLSEEKKEERPGIQHKTYQGKYFKFSYPDPYQAKYYEISAEPPLKEQIVLSMEGLESRKIVVTVRENGGEGLAGDPSLRYRELHPKEYRRKSIATEGLRGDIFSKGTQIFEETAFLLKDAMIISIALTSPLTAEGLSEELDDLLESLSWSIE